MERRRGARPRRRARRGRRADDRDRARGGAVLAALEGRHAEARADMAGARAALAERGLDRLATYLALLGVVVQTLAGDPAAAERAVGDAEATAPGPGTAGTRRW